MSVDNEPDRATIRPDCVNECCEFRDLCRDRLAMTNKDRDICGFSRGVVARRTDG